MMVFLKNSFLQTTRINRDPDTGKLCGDVDFNACESIAGMITKVPGGVGPMTITMLMTNTIEAFETRMSR